MSKTDFIGLRLDLFDEGGAAASGEAAADAGANTVGDETANGMPLSENTESVSSPQQTEDYSAEFEREIKKGGKYYDAFQKRATAVAGRATGKAKALQEKLDGSQKVLDVLGKMTGKDPSDIDGMLTALQDNNSFFENYAMQNGISVSEAKLKFENEMLKDSEKRRLEAAAAEENRKQLERAAADKMRGWMQEADQVKAKYADIGIQFDLQKELANPDFKRLLQSMRSVEAAFRTIHFDEIMNARENIAVKRTQEQAVNAIKNNRSRPLEGGVNASKGVKTEQSVSGLTPKDRERIARDLMSGKNPFNN